MTPAITFLERANAPFQVHEYHHDSSVESYGLEAAEKLGVAAQQVFKTLVVALDNKDYAVAIIPVAERLNMKHIAKAAQAKKAAMADKHQVERMSGYVVGGVSPFGQKKILRTFIHNSAQQHTSIFVSAGKRGLDVELAPELIINLLQAQYINLTA